MRNDCKAYLLAGAGVAIFAMTLPATRLAVADLPPLTVTLGRGVLAGVLAAVFLVVRRSPLPERGDLGGLLVVFLCLVLGFPLFSSLAMRGLPASHGAVVLGILPLMTAVAATLFKGERLNRHFWQWACVGTALVIGFVLYDFGPVSLAGDDLFLLLSVLCAGIGYAFSGDLARRIGGLEAIAWALVLALPLMAAAFAWSAGGAAWQQAGLPAWAAFAYLGLFSQFLGFCFWNRAMALGGIARIGQVQLLQLFITLGGSALLLGEAITPATIVFALLVAWTVLQGRRAAAKNRVKEEG